MRRKRRHQSRQALFSAVEPSPADALSRRRFLQSAAVLVGATGTPVAALSAEGEAGESAAAASVAMPTEARARAELGAVDTSFSAVIASPGSDFMVDVLRAAAVPYVAAMPGSSFRGLHESIVNYGGNRAPEFITCVHEEISAAIAHGYAKVAGKPMACLVHSDVGLQHASMAIYNAWCDRVPMIVIAGNVLDATKRRPGVEWDHTMTDLASMVRDFVKWDDVPVSLQHYAESFMRAQDLCLTPPCAPVFIVADSELQENQIADRSQLSIPKRSVASPPGADPDSIRRAASLLIDAQAPLIIVERLARTQAGVERLVQLAELLNAPVIDRAGRMNMPSGHYLNQTFRERELIRQADLVLAMELTDLWGSLNTVPDLPERSARRIAPPQAQVIAIGGSYLYVKGNVQDLQRYYAADIEIAADAQTCLPELIEAIQRQLTPARRGRVAQRSAGLRTAFGKMRAAAAADAALSWDASPIGTARLYMELWAQVKDLDWALVSNSAQSSSWPQRLWNITQHYQYVGGEGGYGVGYGAPAAAGAALAHRDAGRIAIAIEGDGDFMVLPGSLWTLAHHHIPLLMVMHNNRAWHQETMHLQRMANRRNRNATTWRVGTVLEDPYIDFAALARSMGVWSKGPIAEPQDLQSAIAEALAVVRSGAPALLDVLTQPR